MPTVKIGGLGWTATIGDPEILPSDIGHSVIRGTMEDQEIVVRVPDDDVTTKVYIERPRIEILGHFGEDVLAIPIESSKIALTIATLRSSEISIEEDWREQSTAMGTLHEPSGPAIVTIRGLLGRHAMLYIDRSESSPVWSRVFPKSSDMSVTIVGEATPCFLTRIEEDDR